MAPALTPEAPALTIEAPALMTRAPALAARAHDAPAVRQPAGDRPAGPHGAAGDAWDPARPRGLSTWQALDPTPPGDDAVLAAIERELDRPETVGELRACEAAERYPEAILARLYRLGLLTLFADPLDDPAATPTVSAWRVNALCALAARRSGSLAVAVAHNGLAMLPLYIAGSPEQLHEASSRLRQGRLAALLLSERDHGSDLLGSETRAVRGALAAEGSFQPTPDGESYRVRGTKHLINGGARADLLVTLARTRQRAAAPLSPFDVSAELSLFMIRRDASVRSPGKARTLPVAAAEIAGVEFDDTIVPASARIGTEGDGFSIVQRALAISRCAIGAFAAGAANSAVDLAYAYARRRVLYDAPITRLECIADHLARLAALDLAVTALSIKATAMVNVFGQGAAHYTAVAKLMCCALAEEAVDEGRRALGAAALVTASPYERLVRDAPLYGVFDGTSHVMLEQLQRRLAQAAAKPAVRSDLDALRDVYNAPPAPLVERLRQRVGTTTWPVATHAAALARLHGVPLEWLPVLGDALLELTRTARRTGRWDADQALRFALADVFGRLEAVLALVELGDGRRRAALGLPPRHGGGTAHLDRVYGFAVHWLGAGIAGGLRRLAILADESCRIELDDVERTLLCEAEASRRTLVRSITHTAGDDQ